MRIIAPDYYHDFACIAGACRHSCCKGWEIDVDDDSLERFRQVEGALGDRLRDAILEDDDGAHFVLTEDERCPFLNAEGLCDLICELGKDCLCQICADHPRFRSFWSDRMEIGLGLCCEAAASLILRRTDKVQLTEIGDDDEPACTPDDEENDLRQFRDELIGMAQDRSLPILERMQRLPETCGCAWPASSPVVWAFELLKLERLDNAWTARLNRLKDAPVPDMDLTPYALPLEQLMVYLLYRHLPAALEDGQGAAHLLVCCVLWQTAVWLLCAEGGGLDTLEDIARMLSSELEYSQENLDAIRDAFI